MEGRMKFHHTANTARKFGYGENERSASLDTPTPKINSNSTMSNLSTHSLRSSKMQLSASREFRLQELAALSLAPIMRTIQNWWLQRAERHYLICADVEQQRAREAQMNVAYYQKRAAMARSSRH
jgi:hypothetical protein